MTQDVLLAIGAVLLAALPINALVFWLGTRKGAAGVARDELLARRRTPRFILGGPKRLEHMATARIDVGVERMALEAFAIMRGESPLSPTADHLAALAAFHADAVHHYDELGAQLTQLRRRFRETQEGRNQLARFIRREIDTAAAAEDGRVTVDTASRLHIGFVRRDRRGFIDLGAVQ